VPLFRSRPHHVSAEQLTPDHKPERLKFGRIHAEAQGPVHYLETPSFPRPKRQHVYMGHWVVEHPDGSVQTLYPEEFESMYEPVEVDTENEADSAYDEFLVSDTSGSGG
jgi:hypothetical protein